METEFDIAKINFIAIIKNYNKFNEMTLKPTMNLAKMPTEKREGNIGISTKSTGLVWHITKRGKMLFKSPLGMVTGVEENEIRKLNEMLVYGFAKLAKLNCAEYAIVRNGKEKGVGTYNFLKANEILISFAQFCRENDLPAEESDFYNIIKTLENGAYSGCKFNINEIKKQMFEQLVLDTLTLQTDRNLSNICFVLNEKTKQLKMSPIHDNEFAFMTNCLYYAKYLDPEEVGNIKEYVNNCYFGVLGAKPFLFNSMDICGVCNPFVEQVKQIVNYASTNKQLAESLVKIVKACNVQNLDAMYLVLQKNGNRINEYYKTYTKCLLNYSQTLFKENMRLHNINSNAEENSTNVTEVKDINL